MVFGQEAVSHHLLHQCHFGRDIDIFWNQKSYGTWRKYVVEHDLHCVFTMGWIQGSHWWQDKWGYFHTVYLLSTNVPHLVPYCVDQMHQLQEKIQFSNLDGYSSCLCWFSIWNMHSIISDPTAQDEEVHNLFYNCLCFYGQHHETHQSISIIFSHSYASHTPWNYYGYVWYHW